jgi:quercetin dioxygenase-like cupin family protein
MRHLALATAVLALGCSSSKKPPANPTPPTGGGATTPEPAGGAAATTGGTATGNGAAMAAKAPPPPPDTGGFKLVPAASLAYKPIDPSKPGGPEVALVTGDLESGGGFFLKLPPGSKSGLHTHSSDYHAVVVGGAPKHWIAGEEKKAKPLGVGSYWFQPGTQPHGDECTGTEPCVLYLVVMGKFDFAPAPNAKAVKPGKYSLVASAGLKWNPMDPKQPNGPKMAIVSGDPKTGPVAFIIELPPDASSGLHSHTSEYHGIVIQGAPAHWLPHEKNEGEPQAPGTYFFQPGGYDHGDRCTGTTPCRTFIMMPKALDYKPAEKTEKK